MSNEYVQVLYHKIEELIRFQRDTYVNENGDITDVDEFLDIQRQINELFEIITASRGRAMKQIVYNQFMYDNATKHDARISQDMGMFVFITVNPLDQYIDPKILLNSAKNFMDGKYVEYGAYTIEQRSENQDYHGCHLHILLKRCRPPSVIRNAIKSNFLHLVGNNNAIKIMTKDAVEDCYGFWTYISGAKKNQAKHQKQAMDVEMRKKYGFQDLYTVGDCHLLVRQSPSVHQGKITLKIKPSI